MKFLDKDGKSLSPQAWQQLYRDKKYCHIERRSGGGHIGEISWVGVWANQFETKPKIFLVKMWVEQHGKELDKTWNWFATLKEAKKYLDGFEHLPKPR